MPKIALHLDSEKIERLKEYLSWVQEKNNSRDEELSDYWMYHTGQIDIRFDENTVYLSGESGFYFPRKLTLTSHLRKFARLFPTRLSNCVFAAYRKILPSLNETLNTYQSAYEKIWKRAPEMTRSPSSQHLELQELENKVLNFRTIKGMKKKWWASKKQILSEETIRSYFYLQLMEGHIQNLHGSTVCEIGSGTGNLASLFYYHFNTKLILVDLPKTFVFSFSYLSQVFPDLKILLPNEIGSGNFDLSKYDVTMMTPKQTSLISDEKIDLTVNIASMQEMTKESINFYFDMIDRIIKPKGHFFSCNRVEKIMSGEPIRFSEYPWRSHTQTIFFEINPLSGLTQLDPVFVRLEQYP